VHRGCSRVEGEDGERTGSVWTSADMMLSMVRQNALPAISGLFLSSVRWSKTASRPALGAARQWRGRSSSSGRAKGGRTDEEVHLAVPREEKVEVHDILHELGGAHRRKGGEQERRRRVAEQEKRESAREPPPRRVERGLSVLQLVRTDRERRGAVGHKRGRQGRARRTAVAVDVRGLPSEVRARASGLLKWRAGRRPALVALCARVQAARTFSHRV